MTALQKPVYQARRRLWLNRWLWALGWTFTGAAGLFAVLVLVQRAFSPFREGGLVLGAAAIGLAALSVLVALFWMWATRESLDVAAARLDDAAGLKERLSTGLYCASLSGSSDPFAQAVVADARRVAASVTPSLHLPIRFPRSGNYAGVGLVAALLILWVFPTLDLVGAQQQKRQEEQKSDAVQRTEAQVRPVIQQTLEKIRDQNPALKDDLDALAPLQTAAQPQTPLDVRRDALKKIEQLGEKLESKRNSAELAKVDEFKRMLRRLAAEEKSNSAVGQLAQSLAKGDFKSAQAAIAALQKELSRTPATPQEQQQAEDLKKQLKQLSEKIDQIAANDRKLEEKLRDAGLSQEELKKALENLKKEDFQAVAKQLADKGLSQEQVNKAMQEIQKRCQACSSASKLASKLGSAGKAGGGQGAAQQGQSDLSGLSEAGEQLSQMEAMDQQLKELDSALAELDSAKNQLGGACKACNGTGQCNGKACGACNGTGMCQGGQGMGQGRQGMGRGSGMGQNPGQGEGGVAPSQETAFNLRNERTPVKTGQGSIVSQQFVDGEQFKGEVSKEFREAAMSAQRQVTDAVAREEIPRQYQGSVKEYFTRSTRGLQGDQTPAGQSPPAESADKK